MELLIFILPPVFKAVYDAKKGNTNHLAAMIINGLVILALAIVISLMNTTVLPWWVYLICGLAIQWAIFDDLYNIIKGHKFGYIGDPQYHKKDIFYKLYDYFDWWIIELAKIFALITAGSLYFQFDLL